MAQIDDLSSRLQVLTDFIENAQLELANGQVVNLSHLDDEVAQLCDQIVNLPPTEAIKIQPLMANMIGKLEELSISLKDFRNSFKPTTGIQ